MNARAWSADEDPVQAAARRDGREPAAVAQEDRAPATGTAVPITVAYGDGIGPEIMAASLRILAEAGASIAPEKIEIGEPVYRRGISAGIEPTTWDSLRRTKVFLKAPITTPQGGGFKSLNVTTRKTLGLYANVRPCTAYHPFVQTRHPAMDLVIIRENEEDLYAGIEHRQTQQVVQCLKLITVPGTEKIVRHAFEYARTHNRRKVSCFTKDNIMKMTDGLFHRIFDEVAAEYPEIAHEHCIVDIGAARLADTPEAFDVVVLPNLYGDILSDIAAQIAGSVGLGGSANIGEQCAMFEAIHGSAPPLAGRNLANPSGLLLGAVMMLVHIGQPGVATRIHNAWLRTIEEGIHTADIYSDGMSTQQAGTMEFADAVITRLGQTPEYLTPVAYPEQVHQPARPVPRLTSRPTAHKELVGVDAFLDWSGGTPDHLGQALHAITPAGLELVMISNRGVKVWPHGLPETFCTDHWRCRFMSNGSGAALDHAAIIGLLQHLGAGGFDCIKTENLYTFDGTPGFSLGQGQ